MPINLPDALPILSIILTIAAVIGGIFAFRSGYGHTAINTQEKAISALQAQNSALEVQNEVQGRQISSLGKEIDRLNGVVTGVMELLKRRGLRIEVEGKTITLIDETSRRERITQIHITDEERLSHGEEK